GAAWSAVRFARAARGRGAAPRAGGPPPGRMAAANVLIALGTLVLSGGGTLQGVLGHDEAFTLSLACGITVIYGGFLVAARRITTVHDDRQRLDADMTTLGAQAV
ncbi:MAG TPA: hypothetical protein VHL53_11165, partial [Acidimicrobiia bacterium]|nr:hypothetical protein [Acidimicrobiia bacterium]